MTEAHPVRKIPSFDFVTQSLVGLLCNTTNNLLLQLQSSPEHESSGHVHSALSNFKLIYLVMYKNYYYERYAIPLIKKRSASVLILTFDLLLLLNTKAEMINTREELQQVTTLITRFCFVLFFKFSPIARGQQ